MKSLQTLLVAAVAALALSACGEKKTTGDIIAKKPEAKAASGPVKMQDSRFMEEVKWKDKSCYVNIVRRADTSLPVVKDDAGGQYYDNVIDVTIESHKEDGAAYESKPIFQKTFGKQDFASQVDEKYLEKSALLGIVYDHVDGDNLVFAASVGAPDALSDDYVPLLLTVSRMGAVSISKDMRLDGEMEE